MKKRICPNCGFYLPIERGMLYCEDCREKLLKKYTEKQVEVPILGEIKDKKIIWYKGRKKKLTRVKNMEDEIKEETPEVSEEETKEEEEDTEV